ncbi:MAG: hypothetical protein PHQ40_04705 [Anaerolineaceae bacterium]|nr:hypothetical protein [Anaerolineaceae bacterium]
MRFIKTFILHLFVDPAVPDRLCGDVRLLEEQANYPFKRQIELEELLHMLIGKSPAAMTHPTGGEPRLDEDRNPKNREADDVK